jgi:protoheme IX farnesyltransferase
MKAATLEPEVLPRLSARVADYLELIRPRIALLILFTVGAGGYLAAGGRPDLAQLGHAVIGTALVAAGASCLNQLLERHTDALMRRTENRPLPGGRLQTAEVALVGLLLVVGGLAYLLLLVRQPLAAALAAFTFVTYVFLYTPLKRITSLNTLVGAVPGAMPPLIGWATLRGSLDVEAMSLFLILFLWQVPHFLAIAWIYRDQYKRAGLCMLTVGDRDGSATARQMVLYCLALVVASLTPVALGMAGPIYGALAILLGAGFLASTLYFARGASHLRARWVLRASLLYLPLLLAALMADARVGG